MVELFETFQDNLRAVTDAIARACAAHGRDPREVTLLPVTKNHPADCAGFVHRAGLPAVGENRVQEARDKKTTAALPALQWELIGHLQSNKARLAAAVFDRIQSVDSVKLLDALDRAAAESGKPLRILLQVNAGRDEAKFGCALEDAPALAAHALTRPHLRLEGLMTIAPLDPDPSIARRTFAALRHLRDDLAIRLGVPLPELSMGMSGDLEAAIAEGSTQVRLGTSLFGTRAPA